MPLCRGTCARGTERSGPRVTPSLRSRPLCWSTTPAMPTPAAKAPPVPSRNARRDSNALDGLVHAAVFGHVDAALGRGQELAHKRLVVLQGAGVICRVE